MTNLITNGNQFFKLAISISILFYCQINFSADAQAETIPNWINVRYSIFNLVEPPDITNPVLTASDVSASFVTDPFLFHENNAWFMFFEVLNMDRSLEEPIARIVRNINTGRRQ